MGKKYKTGTHVSPKSLKPIKYRSSWELVVCLYFDEDPKVLSYEYETIEIPYVSNNKTKKQRKYIVDFLVCYTDGSKKLIEVKRKNKMNNLIVQKKAEAAKLWAEKQGMKYEFWTEDTIKPLKKMFKILNEKLLK